MPELGWLRTHSVRNDRRPVEVLNDMGLNQWPYASAGVIVPTTVILTKCSNASLTTSSSTGNASAPYRLRQWRKRWLVTAH